MTTRSRFERFLENIAVGPNQEAAAFRSANAIARKIHGHYSNAPYCDDTRKIIGSYGKGTAVSPPRDIDVLCIMNRSDYDRFDRYSGNGQSALLQEMKRLFQQRYPNTKEIGGDGQVVVIDFATGHKVEVLPGWHATGGGFLVPDTHGGGRWRHVDHEAEIENVADSDARSDGNTRDLIRMLKAWQTHCSVPIKSLVIELRSVRFLAGWEYAGRSATYYDWMVRDFFHELTGKANSWHTIPGTTEKKHYGDAWLSKAHSAYSRAVKACDYEAADKATEAAYEWRKIFGGQYEF
ncbi:SMODS domain-containing nucleotidyltransferase [Streptomyces sp. NBC_00197]|uniref:SMODS domain-containing nucleotidyltransferase n=1 Tax=Streptomyces sp. NBC_00197 TaxID=2975676 RepID=UPI003250F3BB